MTDGKALFLRTQQGHVFDLLVDPMQPMIADGLPLRPVIARAQRRKGQRAKVMNLRNTVSTLLLVGSATLFAQTATAPKAPALPAPASVFGFEPGADNKLCGRCR